MKITKGVLSVCALALFVSGPAFATGARPPERFASTQTSEPIAHSRSDAAQIAAQVPGAAAVLLEALRYRGKTANQLGLPSSLWCADFMNFVLNKAGGKGTRSRAARSFIDFGKKLDSPRVGAIVIFARGGRNSGHVGVVRGTDGDGNPIVVSGNHGHKVWESIYPKHKVLAYVMPPEYVINDMAKAARAAALTKAEAPLR
jgi:uncharacterized protein (TIGR02594 family)